MKHTPTPPRAPARRLGTSKPVLILLALLWLMGVQMLFAQSGLEGNAVQAGEQDILPRLEQLGKRYERDILPLPRPQVICPEDIIRNPPGGPAEMQNALAKLPELRANGLSTCCFRILAALQAPAARSETEQLNWLRELSATLIQFEVLDSSITVAKHYAALAQKLGQQQGAAWLMEARAYHGKRLFGETFDLAEQALEFARKQHDPVLEAKALSLIGNVSRDVYMIRPEKTSPYLRDALAIQTDLRDTASMISMLTALCLDQLSNTDPHPALDYLEQAAVLLGPRSPLKNRMEVARMIAIFYENQRQPARSNYWYTPVIALSKQLGDRSLTQNMYEAVSGNYMALNDPNQAQTALDSAYVYCSFQRELGYFYHSFGEVAAARGDLPKAVEWYRKAFDEQIKGYDARNTLQLSEWETRFRTREKEIELAEQARRWWLLLGLALALAALFVGAAFAFWLQRKSRRQLAAQHELIEKQAAELRRLDEAKSRFFANVSHELRTPLTLMLGPLGSLLKSNRLDPRDFTLAKTARQHAQQLLNLVNEILDLSKMESGKMRLHETTVSLQPFLRRLVSSFESHAERLGIRFVFEYRVGERLRVLLDEDKLQKVVNNLLANALKFTPPHSGGSVTVRVEDIDNRIRLGVHDTGRGIHPDDLPHVFDRFYQTNQAEAPLEGGTGIGLALCREFAELMGGKIWVESAEEVKGGGLPAFAEASAGKKAEGNAASGSSFYFEFPKKEVLGVKEELSPSPESQADYGNAVEDASIFPFPVREASSANQQTVLLVEDNESLRNYVQLILGEKYRVVTAEHGQAALDWLTLHLPPPTVDLIVSDVMMPVMDGFQFLEKLKSQEGLRQIPVIMLTARADLRDRLRALRIGVDDYLLKPFEEEELMARVANLLANAQARLKAEGGGRMVEGGKLTVEGSEPHPPPSPFPPQPSSGELAWLAELEQTVKRSIGQSQFNADLLAEALFMSRTKFFQQVKRLTGMTPNEYILEVRFRTARAALESRQVSSVKAAAGAAGFRDVEYFSKQFRGRYGKAPSEYL